MKRLLKIAFLATSVFGLSCIGWSGIDDSWAEQRKDYKMIYKENKKASDKAPATKKNQWVPFTRAVQHKRDAYSIHKGDYLREGIQRGRPETEDNYKKDMGIKPEAKKSWLATGQVKTGAHGIKKTDIKGPGTKPYTNQFRMEDDRKPKDIKIRNLKRLR